METLTHGLLGDFDTHVLLERKDDLDNAVYEKQHEARIKRDLQVSFSRS